MKSICLYFYGFLFLLVIGCQQETTTHANGNVGKLNIETNEPIPIQENISVSISHLGTQGKEKYYGKIRRRGGFSISFPKHSYEVDFKEDISIFGLPKDDDWIINSNYIDKTFLRHVISYELFAEMGNFNIAPLCKHIEVILNGQYKGLYVLMEKLDKSSLNINDKDSTSFIFKEPHLFRKSYQSIIPQKLNNFQQQTFPKIEDNDKTWLIDSIRQLINNTDDQVFTKSFLSVFDLDNILSWHLLLLITNNNDGILKNFYLYKTDGKTPIRVAPWDYDHSFGRDGDNELNLDQRQLELEKSTLFSRLLTLEWYKHSLKNKWEELNIKGVLSQESITKKILNKSKSIKPWVEKNHEIWPINDSIYFDSNNFGEEVAIMIQFIELRHDRLSLYFDTL